MGKKIKIQKKRLSSFLLYPAIAIWLLSGCATTTTPSATGGIEADNTRTSLTEQTSNTQKNEIYESQEVQLAAKISEAVQDESDEAEITTISEPRILIEPIQSDLNQVLGIDFTVLEQGKSRLTLTTDKKVDYDLDRKGDKSLVLKLHDTTIIPSVLLREIDTTRFETALDNVKPSFSKENNEVAVLISLREMVPFHIKQAENGLTMDFGQTYIKPPDEKIIPLDLTEAETISLAAATQLPAGTQAVGSTARQKQFKGERMNFDFVDVDVTHILNAINDVTKENILWDSEIKGRRVSMVLKDVPWDEALDLILDMKGLAKRYRGDNIIWVTTKEKMDKFLADEEAEARRQQEAKEKELEREETLKKKAEQQEPLITEYLPVDFAAADEIQQHITERLTDRGTMSIDTRTNTIIIKDTAASIEEAKETIAQFDTPVKQIMIEARIVDASDTFSRNLGVRWNVESRDMGISTDEGGTVDIVGTGAGHINDNGAGGGNVIGGTFSTNAPTSWDGNIGVYFGRLTSNGMGILSLDASLAIAESEGTAKTLSAPKVIAQEGSSATIMSGETIYTNPTENVAQTSRNAALTLNVSPTSISYNGYITMEIAVTDNKNVSPTLDTTKEIHSTLMVKSGETIVIGGILKETESEDVAGVPVLKDIPGLGWLFKAKTKTKHKSELLIFLTPTVLATP